MQPFAKLVYTLWTWLTFNNVNSVGLMTIGGIVQRFDILNIKSNLHPHTFKWITHFFSPSKRMKDSKVGGAFMFLLESWFRFQFAYACAMTMDRLKRNKSLLLHENWMYQQTHKELRTWAAIKINAPIVYSEMMLEQELVPKEEHEVRRTEYAPTAGF